ncbi:MAG: hypothetical protein K6B15_05180 [Parasporobacterium sp.]|nr:hypothetical protein [Parasporobacterium sp.]
MIKYKKMAADCYKECGLLLARAFADYDYFKIYFPDDKKRALYLQCAMTLTLKLHRDNAVILTAEDDNNLCAVCILFPPNVHRKPALDYLLNGFSQFKEEEYHYKGKSLGSWSYIKEI